MGKLVFKDGRAAVSRSGTGVRYLGRQFEGGQLTHFRGYKVDLEPIMERVKIMALHAACNGQTGEFGYEGSVPREVIHHWLTNVVHKDWSDYAVDEELKAKFRKWFKARFPACFADFYRERPLTINRTLGSKVLEDYRKETSCLSSTPETSRAA